MIESRLSNEVPCIAWADAAPCYQIGEVGTVNIYEYQAKDLLRQAGIPVQPGEVAMTAADAEAIARRAPGAVVIKAQVHAGGRGKAGGVKLARTPDEARTAAERILWMSIKGLVVHRVLVAQAADIASE